MAIFSKKIVSAKFMDYPNNMIIELLYNENDKLISYVLDVDFTRSDFNELLEEITLDEIEQNTKKQIQNEVQLFEKVIQNEIDRRWKLDEEKRNNLRTELQNKFSNNEPKPLDIKGNDFLSIINSKNENDDFIFNLKISILEDPDIIKSKNKTLKLNIRKSKSVWELLKIYTNAKF